MKLNECNAYLHTYKCEETDCSKCIYNPELKIKENVEAANRKYRYAVSMLGDDISDGYIELTKKQADVVKFATNTKNWEDAELNSYSGTFFINTDKPIELTSDIKKYISSDERYKNFILLHDGEDLIDLLKHVLRVDNIPLIQVHSIEPVEDDKGKIINIVGFVGQCAYKDGEIISLDGDSYSPKMTVYGYEWFDYNTTEVDGLGLGLDILVGNN